MKMPTVATAGTATALMALAVFAAGAAENVYRVTDRVAVKAPPNFSTNVEFGNYAPWSLDHRVNAWNLFANLEPMDFQHWGQGDGGGADFLEHKSGARLSNWDQMRSGFWDGADIYIYRIADGTMKLMRRTKVARSVSGKDPATGRDTEERLYFAERGEPVVAGDLYYLRMTDARVKIQLGCIATLTFEVGKDWRKFEFDVPWETPERPYPQLQSGGTALKVGGVSDGTLWMDNFLIWQADLPPFAILPQYVAALKEFKPHVLRLWAGNQAPSLDYLLGEGFARKNKGGVGKSEAPNAVGLGQSLRLCAEVGCDPWLIVNPFFTADENAKLMEYLAAPADVGYGKLRAGQGRPEPWTKAFKKIYIESANEAWNSMFNPNWAGRPQIYAAVADRQFGELKRSEFFDRDRFEFILNGWDSGMALGGWTPGVAAGSHEGDRIDIALYSGGWEKGAGAGEAGDGDEVYQDKLFSTALEFGPKFLDALYLDPLVSSRLAAALGARPALFDRAVGHLATTGARWTAEDLATPAGMNARDTIRALLARDAAGAAELTRALARLRYECEYAVWIAARMAMGADDRLRPATVEALSLESDPALVGKVCAGLCTGGVPGDLDRIVQEYPAQVERWIGSGLIAGPDLAVLERVKAGGKFNWNIASVLRTTLDNRIRGLIEAGDAAFLAALDAQMQPPVIAHPINYNTNYALNGFLPGQLKRAGTMVLLAMRADARFRKLLWDALAADPEIFAGHADDLLHAIAAGIADIAGAAPGGAGGDRPFSALRGLPPATGKRYAEIILRESARAASLDARARPVAEALLLASLGDPGPARALPGNAALKAALGKQLADAVASPVIECAKLDAALGDELTAAVGAVPQSAGAKGLANYEGGPGYSLPGPGKAPPEEDENLGKSLVMGVSTLDVYMLALASGARPMCYYSFKSGPYWASHNHPDSMIPYPSWLALMLRNLHCAGDLMEVERVAAATVDIPDKEIIATTNDGKGSAKRVKGRKNVPLTACYAFRDGNREAFMLLNRSLRDAQEVALELPFAVAGGARVFALTHPDPKAHNRAASEVKIGAADLKEFRAGQPVTVPPASALVLVVGRQ